MVLLLLLLLLLLAAMAVLEWLILTLIPFHHHSISIVVLVMIESIVHEKGDDWAGNMPCCLTHLGNVRPNTIISYPSCPSSENKRESFAFAPTDK
jgi:hypothetical protein